MTRIEWIDTIFNTISAKEESERYTRPFIDKHIQSVYEQMMNEAYRSGEDMWKYVRNYTETASSVTLSSGHTIPTLPVTLSRTGGGLYGFSDSVKTYMITSRQYLDYATNADFDTVGIDGVYFIAVSGDKIYGTASIANGLTLTYKLIPKFTSLATTDEVIVPGGNEDHFIDRVIDTIQHVPVVDLLNDNA